VMSPHPPFRDGSQKHAYEQKRANVNDALSSV
jgi:hypothetical protein